MFYIEKFKTMENNKEKSFAEMNGDLSISQEEHIMSHNPVTGEDIKATTYGLTKREWLSGMAVQGLTMNNSWTDEQIAMKAVNTANSVLKRLEYMK